MREEEQVGIFQKQNTEREEQEVKDELIKGEEGDEEQEQEEEEEEEGGGEERIAPYLEEEVKKIAVTKTRRDREM